MQNVQITKVVRTKESVKIEFSSDEDRNGITETNGHKSVMKFVPHEDFALAFENLVFHLVKLSELEKNPVKGENDNFVVDGISISSKSQFSGVKILGHKELSDGRIVGIVAPFTALDEESSTYTFISDLIEAVETLESEAVQYLEGKHAMGGTQLKLADDYHTEKQEAA